MFFLKQALILGMAAFVAATPVAITENSATALVKDSIANAPAPQSANVSNDILARGGSCNQGDCPDYNGGVDLIYQWTVIPQPGVGGAPPIPLVTMEYHGRWNHCDKCGRVKTSSDGCFSFTGCGVKQDVCIDEKNKRMHRIYRDTGRKKCWGITSHGLGGCGFVKETIVFTPTDEIPCNW